MTREAIELDRLASALSDRYQLEGEIGVGGMATVYRAVDVRHHRVVAIKVLRDDVAESIGRERFLREIRVLSGLAHPNILPLHDSGETDGFLYFVMPFVGESLRDILTRQVYLPVDDALRFAAEIGDALDFAHSHGVVHRDIKPENVLMEGGHAIVSDFGIAKALDVAFGMATTSTHSVIGTSTYMSPEQGTGDAHIDGRSDLYSLACVTYEMLAGTVPFTGPTGHAIQARKTLEPIPSVSRARPSLGASVEQALRRALSVIPGDRFGTAREFVAALRQDHHPTRWGRKTALIASVGASIALVAFGAGYWSPFALPPSNSLRVAVTEFTNRTGDPSFDAVGFMASDWITEGLQRIPSLDVVPTPASVGASRFLQAAQPATAATILDGLRRETGASVIVSGTYYRSGDTLTFQSRVVDATTGALLIAIGPVLASVNSPIAAIAELRTRAMGYLASTSDERMAGRDELRDSPPTYEAYRAFSSGMSAYLASDYGTALRRFAEASERDSTFATPRLFASICLSNLDRLPEADSVGHQLAAMRDRLNPYYQDWLDYRLAYMAEDRPRALVAVRRLASRAPGTKATYNLAVEALENGHLDEALRSLKTLAPDRGAMRGWIPYWQVLGKIHHLRGDYRAELEAGDKARAMYPQRRLTLLLSVRALAALGRRADLVQLLTEAEGYKEDPSGTTMGWLLREAGDESAAHGFTSLADTLRRRSLLWFTHHVPFSGWSRADSLTIANLLYSLGRTVEARALLDTAAKDVQTSGLLGLLAVEQGRDDEARSAIARLTTDTTSYQFGAPAVMIARIAAARGDSLAALASLRRAFVEGQEYDLWIHRTTEFARIRKNRAFQELTAPH